MSAKVCFIDSNIWIYMLLPGQDVEKAKVTQNLIRQEKANILISTQIVNEVANVIIRQGAMDEAEIREFISRFYARYTVHQFSQSTQLNASHLREKYSFAYWDSLLVAAALEAQATRFYSEDMQNGLVVDGRLTILNPFATTNSD